MIPKDKAQRGPITPYEARKKTRYIITIDEQERPAYAAKELEPGTITVMITARTPEEAEGIRTRHEAEPILLSIWRRICETFKQEVCGTWQHSSKAFTEWAISAGFKPGKYLLRHDIAAGFSPENCFWARSVKQNATKQFLTVGGIRKSISEWAQDTGVPYETIRGRIITGKTPEEIISKTPLPRGRKPKK